MASLDKVLKTNNKFMDDRLGEEYKDEGSDGNSSH